jgi:hypothetical protein
VPRQHQAVPSARRAQCASMLITIRVTPVRAVGAAGTSVGVAASGVAASTDAGQCAGATGAAGARDAHAATSTERESAVRVIAPTRGRCA